MTRRLLLTLTMTVAGTAGVAAGLTGLAGERTPSAKPAADGQPHAVAVRETLTFEATAPPSMAGTAEFVEVTVPVTNSTGEAVSFGPLTCGCGCTTSERSADRLDPGATADVRLRVSLNGRTTPFATSCGWSDDHGRAWRVTARLPVYSPVAWEPTQVKVGPDGGEASLVEHWRAGTAEPATVRLDTPARLTATADAAVTDEAQPGVVRRTTRVRLAANSPAASDPDAPAVFVVQAGGVGLTVIPPPPTAVAVPARLGFVFGPTDGPKTLRLQVRPGAGGPPLTVTAATCDLPGMTAEVGLTVVVTASLPAATAAGVLQLTTTNGDGRPSVVRVPVSLSRHD